MDTPLLIRSWLRPRSGADQQRHQFESQRQPYGIAAMTDDILTTQRAEIGVLKTWLTQWGLADPAPGR